MLSFSQKNIVITGASKGLGYHAALDFASKGANLALLSRDETSLVNLVDHLEGEQHRYYLNDLSDVDQTEIVATKVLDDFDGKIDVVLHAAGGGYGMREPLISSNEIYTLFMGNLGGAINLNRLFIPSMIKQEKGSVIHIGSIASHEITGSVGYNTVKSATSAYVRTIGKEMAQYGVVITGILPGGFVAKDNAMIRLKENKPDIYQEFIDERLPRGYMGDVSELIPMVRYLSSNDASMMGGCMVPIDAGEGNAYLL